jgi:hypothetical protein
MGSNGESVNWLPDGLIITSVPPEPQGTTATCAVTAKSNTRFPFDPREPWTLVAGPFHSLSRPVTSIQQSQAGPILYLLMTQLLAIFFSDVVRVFRVIIIARFHSYRHNHQQKRGSVAAPNDFIYLFFSS